ncbi:MAG TPA: Mu transposase C-terminal domain-containing protein [Gallionella sp.]|nr:Mu transposase C-terminal domain-containing protein [Gallionella sp.]
MSKLSTLRIIPGMTVRYEGIRYQVVDLASATRVILKDEHGRLRTVAAIELVPNLEIPITPLPDIGAIKPDRWEQAIEIYNAIEPLVALGPETRTRADVQKVADTIEKHIATVYRWLDSYESTGLLSSLMRKPRKDAGIKRLDERVEKIVTETIETFYLTKQVRTPAKTAFEVRKVCIQNGLPPPDPSTVRNRVFEISEEYRLRRRRGSKAAQERFQPIRGAFPGADFPLAVVQIDHTPVDVIIVDDEHRKAIKRPFLTIATDVYSKMCVGFYLSLDNPGGLATGLCMSRAILGKESYLAKLGLDQLSWPCWGVMHKVHTDNAKEFRGTLLGHATKQYGIVAERRPKGRPQYGGDVERAFRTFMHEVDNELPGTTFSNVQEKQEYDSEGRAVMTLDALEKWFTLFFLGYYHQRPHAGNDGIPPIVKWERGIFGNETMKGTGIPMRVPDEERLRIDFMPFVMRTVQEYGIQIMGISYWADALRQFIHSQAPQTRALKQEFICRYDPRDLSKIWVFEPKSDKYIEAPYRDLSRAPISLWELKDAKRHLRAESKSVTNEELIFKTIDQMRALVESESAKTKAARTKRQRRKQWDAAPKISLERATKASAGKTPHLSDQITELEEFTPFDGIRES